jgi:hypothetical protein
VPVASTQRVTLLPTTLVWLCGWLVMTGCPETFGRVARSIQAARRFVLMFISFTGGVPPPSTPSVSTSDAGRQRAPSIL